MRSEILDELRKVRDENAKGCTYGMHRKFKQMRSATERLKTDGWRVVNRSSCGPVVREQPDRSGD